jgi:putative ABC transport system permease protein
LILNLSFGLIGFATIDSFQRSFQASMLDRSKSLVGGDVVLSSSFPISQETLQAIKSDALNADAYTTKLSMFSMLSHGEQSRLVSLQVVGENFPLHGEFRGENFEMLSAHLSERRVALDPELALQVGARIGDSIKIGDIHFTYVDSVKEDSTSGGQGFNIAPRAYIHLDDIEATISLVLEAGFVTPIYFKLRRTRKPFALG